MANLNVRQLGPEPDGATPLDEEALEQLVPDFVANRADLNAVESSNILRALPWATSYARSHGPEPVLSYRFAFELHRRMFADVWKWAGTQRRRGTNIGSDPERITTEVLQIFDDTRYWHHNQTFSADELAIRLHQRLVKTHPFPNGNGRHTRLVADLYLISINHHPFTWGATAALDQSNDVRSTYLDALREADDENYAPLMDFART